MACRISEDLLCNLFQFIKLSAEPIVSCLEYAFSLLRGLRKFGSQSMIGIMLFSLSAEEAFSQSKRVDLEDCKYKPLLGQFVARSHPGFGIRGQYDSQRGFEPSSQYFPVYGYWCGPGYPKAGNTPAPFDELDAMCRAHDQCYANNGYSNCSCDSTLVKSIRLARRAGKDSVRCKHNGKWRKEKNPYYYDIENYFRSEMSKRNCPVGKDSVPGK